MSYDVRYRKRTLEYYHNGHTFRETCKIFGLSSYTLSKWINLLNTTGQLKDEKRKPKTGKIDREKLREYLRENPDAYQSEIAEYFNCSQSLVCYMLRSNGYNRKKR